LKVYNILAILSPSYGSEVWALKKKVFKKTADSRDEICEIHSRIHLLNNTRSDILEALEDIPI
jgi:hypothetical protein